MCVRCKCDVRPAWRGDPQVGPWDGAHKPTGKFILKCDCVHGDPILTERPHMSKEAYGKMVNESMVKRPDVIPMSEQAVKAFISPDATEAEVKLFLLYCRDTQLNPITREVYLIKYDKSKPASIVVGVDALIKRAGRNQHYDGYDAGIVVKNKASGQREKVVGSLFDPGSEVLLGGWCTLKRRDRKDPLEVTVSFHEYDKHQAQWRAMPAGMIEKVAIGQAHRRGYPDELEGLYETTLTVEVGEAISSGEQVANKASLPEPELGDLFREPPAKPSDPGGEPIAEAVDESADAKMLRFCPLHGEAWEDGRFGPQHTLPGSDWCQQAKVVNGIVRQRMEKARAAMGHSDADVREWVKARYTVTLSKLPTEEKVAAMVAYEVLAAETGTPPAPDDAPSEPTLPVDGSESVSLQDATAHPPQADAGPEPELFDRRPEALPGDVTLDEPGFWTKATDCGWSQERVEAFLLMTPAEWMIQPERTWRDCWNLCVARSVETQQVE